MLQTINNSSYKILATSEDVEVDRIVTKNEDNLILQLRVRNNTKNPIKIYSFVVSEFYLPTEFEVKEVLENGWLQGSEVGYKKLTEVSFENKIFLQRDTNPYSFKKEYGYIDGSIVSEWFTDIRGNIGNIFIGAVTTADQYSQVFVKKVDERVLVRVTCQYDGLLLNPGQVVKSEKIFFAVGGENKIKNDFSKSLAKHMNVKKISPSIRAMCNSYYWNGNKIDENLINNELDALEKLPQKLNLDYFQIDAGYTKYFGDYLDYKERFPDGFFEIIKRIKNFGYKPAIWLSPFAINPTTKLHDYHRSWFLKGDHKKHFEGRLSSPFDEMSNILDLEVLDPTLEVVQNYLSDTFKHFKNLGFEFFKIDFMYPVSSAQKYSIPVTRAQALRIGVETIRKAVGDETPLLSCITQLSPLVGLVDYVRTGIDTLNPFVCKIPIVNTLVNDFMLEKNIKESSERLFLNGVVWRADPDVLIFRNDTGIDKEIVKKHKKFAKENKMCLWIGDSINKMDEKTKKEVLKFFNED